MYQIKELQSIINKEIENRKIGREPFSLYDPINYTLSNGGKRIRPILTLMACNLFSEKIDQAIDAALAIEIFHNFTLLHDDIMDKADIRRGNPTVHKKWNENTAILSGDAMFIKSYDFLFETKTANFKEILRVFNDTALEVCEGQQYDMEFETRQDVSENDYLRMIELKTSVLLAAALKIGALIGVANQKDSDLLYDFGKNIGLAFQLQDDLLDIYGDTKSFGKEIGGDIVANKKTFLLIKTKQLAGKADKELLEKYLNDQNVLRKEKVIQVTSIYNKLGIKELTQEIISEYHYKAMNQLQKVSVPNERKTELIKLAESLIEREK
jgi:geranylgeranyl diphosphate synthase, type II